MRLPEYHKPEGLPGYRIVGFEVMAYSVSSEKIDSDCNPAKDFSRCADFSSDHQQHEQVLFS